MKRTALAAALLTATPVLTLVSQAAAPAYTVKALTLTTTVAAEGALGSPAASSTPTSTRRQA
jgi:hypothetical protein